MARPTVPGCLAALLSRCLLFWAVAVRLHLYTERMRNK